MAVFVRKEEPKEEPRRPWYQEIWLYPFNPSGITHLAMFVFVLFIAFIRDASIENEWSSMTFFLMLHRLFAIIIGLFFLYFIFYLTECIHNTADGDFEAPPGGQVESLGQLLWQLFYALAGIAVCMGPAILYNIFMGGREDAVFFVLQLIGYGFIPMAMLAVALHGSLAGANPVMLIRSIIKTLDVYMPMAASIMAMELIFGLLNKKVESHMFLSFVFNSVHVYLLLVFAHVLGRFYRFQKEKLDWLV